MLWEFHPDAPLDWPYIRTQTDKIASASAPNMALSAAPNLQSGFWRSPTGENHGRNSMPGDVWCEPGDIHDIDRMNWLERHVRWNDPANTAKVAFTIPTVPYCTLREAIDAAILSNG
jgi:hypothetical protein